MNKLFLKNSYYFTIIIFTLACFLIFLLFLVFEYEKQIEQDMFKVATSDVLQITNNKAEHIKKMLKKHTSSDNYIKNIKKNTLLQQKLEQHLKNLITENIKYSYLLYKDKNNIFRFLVDASPIGEKAFVNQKFDITNDKWFEIYISKQPIIIKHTVLKQLSLSYLVPILNEKDDVKLILVIDFAIDKLENINKIISMMKSGLYFILTIIVIFFIVFIIQLLRYKSVKKLSFTDKLTNVHNRNYLQEIEDKVKLEQYVLAVLDIDYFKNVNDTYGHSVGDLILKEVGGLLLNTIRTKDDIIVRYGGEEFIIFIKKDKDNTSMPLNVIERIFRLIKEKKMFINEKDYINITVSIGINLKPNQSKSFLEAFELADKALYEAKQSGRDTIKIYN